MTTIIEVNKKCGICRSKNEFIEITSTNRFGSPDLDTRPPEMMRSTIHTWVQRCPDCGYCASDLSKLRPGAKTVVSDVEYINQLNNKAYPELANSFLCEAMIDHQAGDYARATWDLIHAAWASDDAKRSDEARTCRIKAMDMLAKAENYGQQVIDQNGASTALLVDLLRRSGQSDEARRVIEENRVGITDDILLRILDFQSTLIKAGDLSCHTISEALGERE